MKLRIWNWISGLGALALVLSVAPAALAQCGLPNKPIKPSAFYPQLGVLNLMRLGSPESAILSAIIFNALIIIALIPLALRGVRYRPIGAAGILRRNLLIYGLGGIVAPFVGIKLIDTLVTAVGLA